MDINDFFQQSEGRWFSQRTSHLLASKQSESSKSNIQFELLAADAPAVVQLCERSHVDPALALCGGSITTEITQDLSSRKRIVTTLLVPLANPENPNEGSFLHTSSTDSSASKGRYSVGTDEALTLIIDSDSLSSEERLWFASPNLRLRTSVIKRPDGFSVASFSTEIRLGVTHSPAASDASTSAS